MTWTSKDCPKCSVSPEDRGEKIHSSDGGVESRHVGSNKAGGHMMELGHLAGVAPGPSETDTARQVNADRGE